MKEKLSIWIAYLLPRRVVGWAFIRVVSHATTGQYSNTVVPDITVMEALKRWEAA